MTEQYRPIDDSWSDAILVQDACNATGVALAMHRLGSQLLRICARDKRGGTDTVNRDPRMILFASKLASLTRCDEGDEFHRSYMLVMAERDRVAKEEAR
jgi:hypothetical protein